MLVTGSRDVGFGGADWVANLDASHILVDLLDTGLDPVKVVAAGKYEQACGACSMRCASSVHIDGCDRPACHVPYAWCCMCCVPFMLTGPKGMNLDELVKSQKHLLVASEYEKLTKDWIKKKVCTAHHTHACVVQAHMPPVSSPCTCCHL